MGETPFTLTYGTKEVLPLNIMIESLRVSGFDTCLNEAEWRQDLDMLDEKHQAARLWQVAYKARTKKLLQQTGASKELQNRRMGAEEKQG